MIEKQLGWIEKYQELTHILKRIQENYITFSLFLFFFLFLSILSFQVPPTMEDWWVLYRQSWGGGFKKSPIGPKITYDQNYVVLVPKNSIKTPNK